MACRTGPKAVAHETPPPGIGLGGPGVSSCPLQIAPTVYTRVTQEILNAIEAGPSKFKMPWHHDGAAVTRPVNIASKKPYRGINTVALWASAQANGFSGGVWGNLPSVAS